MRKLFLVLICLCATMLAGYAGYRSYKVWKQKHLLTMARQYIGQGDTRNALLCLRSAIAANPLSVEANRLAAQVCQMKGAAEELMWRRRVVELNPKSTDDRLALAEAAILFRDSVIASNALVDIDEAGKKTAAYHNAAGSVATAARRFGEAREQFVEALSLDPSNSMLQFNLAAVELRETNAQSLAQGRATLQKLSISATNSGMRCNALRELVEDALNHNRKDSALELSEQLALQTGASFGDQLLHLTVLHETRNPQFKPAMLALEQRARTNMVYIGELTTWQQSRGSADESVAWLQSLPTEVRTNQPVAQLLTESFALLGDWRGLQRTVEHEHWGGADFARHAFLARALRGEELPEAAKSEWQEALALAADRKTDQMMLISMASRWGWLSETEELLWTVVKEFPSEDWASKALTRILFNGGRTRSLLALFKQEMDSRPKDLALKNNLAMIALLLNQNDLNPDSLAQEVYEKAPTNSYFAATYAFSLMIHKKNAQALSILQQLTPAELADPGISGYYGLALEANGDRTKAAKYLKLAAKGRHLPEEQKLFDAALSGA